MYRAFTRSGAMSKHARSCRAHERQSEGDPSMRRAGSQACGSERPQPSIIVLCVYARVAGRAEEAWCEAVELAQEGHDVWVVTRSTWRVTNEHAFARRQLPNLRFVYWDLPGLALLERWSWGRRIRRRLWYWHVDRSMADWCDAIGMRVVRRVTRASRSSITYLAAQPTVCGLGGQRAMRRRH